MNASPIPLPDPLVSGHVAPGFEPVRAAFEANFTELGDIGAGVAVYHRGVKVVDLVGGWSSVREEKPYDDTTLQLVFSTTKGATALCAHILVERGLLELDAPVTTYWPEFVAGDKESVTTRHLLSHRAGLPTVDAQLSLDEVCAWDPIVDALAAQSPFWEPGSAHGYHALTYGWLVGEVVRRITGTTIGEFFRDEVARPLGLDFWIGLPEEEEARVSRLKLGPMPEFSLDGELDPLTAKLAEAILTPGSLPLRTLTLNGSLGQFFGGGGSPYNMASVHAAQMPAANGITNAPSLAKMYASMIGDVDGVRILGDAAVDSATQVASEGPDSVLFTPSRFGLGFMVHYDEFSPLMGPGSFGHTGAGGSVGFADPDAGIGFGYVMNQMRMGLAGDERPARLIAALQSCI